MQKITPFLWFDDNAEEAVNYYVSVFRNSRITDVSRYGEEGAKVSGRPRGSVMVMSFELDGSTFSALNNGPVFKFTPAISFVVNCETEEDVDRYWEGLSDGGEKGQCGWLKDKYGVSWQIVPEVLPRLLQDKDPEKSKRVMQAMLQMTKIDVRGLEQAYGQG